MVDMTERGRGRDREIKRINFLHSMAGSHYHYTARCSQIPVPGILTASARTRTHTHTHTHTDL